VLFHPFAVVGVALLLDHLHREEFSPRRSRPARSRRPWREPTAGPARGEATGRCRLAARHPNGSAGSDRSARAPLRARLGRSAGHTTAGAVAPSKPGAAATSLACPTWVSLIPRLVPPSRSSHHKVIHGGRGKVCFVEGTTEPRISRMPADYESAQSAESAGY